jgi:hypothetical protein
MELDDQALSVDLVAKRYPLQHNTFLSPKSFYPFL